MLLHVDNSLRDHVGHYFHLAASLHDEARARGVAFRAITHRDVTPEVQEAFPVSAVFGTDFHHGAFTSRLLRVVDPRGSWYDFLRANVEFLRDLRVGLKGAGHDDTVLMPMVSHRELLAWAAWMLSRPADRAPELVLMFRLNYTDIEDPEFWNSVSGVAGFGFRVLRLLSRLRRVRVATDSERLADEYRELMGVPVEVFPIPHTEAGAAGEPSPAPEPTARTHLVMLGDLREEKGLPLLIAALQRMRECGELQGLRFTVQGHIGSHWHEHMAGYRRALEEIGLAHLTLLREPLDPDAYYDLVESADMVLVPYRRRTYYARTSGPVVEAFAAGKPVVATDGTWMSDQIARFGAGLTFRDGDADDLARTLMDAHVRRHELHERAMRNRAQWLAFHNPSVFFDQLVCE